MNTRITASVVIGIVAVAGAIIYLSSVGAPGRRDLRGIATPVTDATSSTTTGSPQKSDTRFAFQPPPLSAIPTDEFGQMVLLGEKIFEDPAQYASAYVGNNLRCSNCHLDAGRLAGSAPLWGAYVSYPEFREKNGHVNTFAERLQGCFRFSMNGAPPPLGDKVLVALESYAYWMAKGATVDPKIKGRGYPKLAKSPLPPAYDRGEMVYSAHCVLCHGGNGEGRLANDGTRGFPALWGPDSFNWGAGMGSVTNAAAFIHENMPLGQAGSLTAQEAWDVALFMNSHERSQDPRYTGSVAQTRERFHDSASSMYGTIINGHLLGSDSVPSGGRLRSVPPSTAP